MGGAAEQVITGTDRTTWPNLLRMTYFHRGSVCIYRNILRMNKPDFNTRQKETDFKQPFCSIKFTFAKML